MEIVLNKEDFLNGIKVVKNITSSKGVQPVLSNILIETITSDRVMFIATDLNLGISFKLKAEVIQTGKITLSAKTLEEIVNKLPDKPIVLKLDEETNVVTISCGKSKFELIGINANEYPKVFDDAQSAEEDKEFEIKTGLLNKGIKQTAFSTAQNETGSVLSGVCFNIDSNILEMVATDGNRLTRARKEINSKGESVIFITPSRTLVEVSRIISMLKDDTVKFVLKKNKIVFEFENVTFQSRLIDGTYPKYQQLIPTTNEKTVAIDREELIKAIELVSVMVNERTNIVKFNFENNGLEISTDTPESGSGKDFLDIEYSYENLLIAFNYKYVLDSLKNMDSKNVKVEMSTNLSASIFKPEAENEEEDNNYICLIMPVQVR